MLKDYNNLMKDIDMSKEHCQISILQRDKHAILEGNCIENLFLKDVLPQMNPDSISSNWWFISHPEYKYIGVKIIHSSIPSKADNEVFKNLASHNIPCFFLKYDNYDRNFVIIENFSKNKNILKFNIKQYVNTSIEVKNENRQNKSIELLKSLGILQETAIERLFANSILNNNGLWDIDYFFLEDNHLKVLEIKQKFPMIANRFGLNKELANLFRWLISFNFQIFHVILTKPIWEKKLPSLDFINDKRYHEKSLWVGTNLGNNELAVNEVYTAPPDTSVDGNHNQEYIILNIDKVSIIKNYNSKDKDCFRNFLLNKSDLISIYKIPRMEMSYDQRDDLINLLSEMEIEFLNYMLNDVLVIRKSFDIIKLELEKNIPDKSLIRRTIRNLNREKISEKLIYRFMDLTEL